MAALVQPRQGQGPPWGVRGSEVAAVGCQGSLGPAPHCRAPATEQVRDYFSYPAEPRRWFLRRGAEPALPGLGAASQLAQLRDQPWCHRDGWAGCLLVLVLLLPTQLARSFGLSCACKATLISSPLPRS